jgi:flagellar basal body-associated protein FliL
MQPDYNTVLPDGSTLTERQARNRRILTAIGIVGVVALLVFWAVSYFLSFKSVTLKPHNGITMTFGEPSHGEDGPGVSKEIAKTSSETKKVRVKEGYYAIVYSGTDITTTRVLYHVTNNMTIEAPDNFTLSDSKLAQELDQQSDAITAALQANSKTSAYTPDKAQLYQDGSWYAAKLVPADPDTQDTLVVILHKENGQWKLAVDPAITLYIGDYPKVPQQIIRDINNRQY